MELKRLIDLTNYLVNHYSTTNDQLLILQPLDRLNKNVQTAQDNHKSF